MREHALGWILANVALLAHVVRVYDLAKLLALVKDAVSARGASVANSERVNALLAICGYTSPCGVRLPLSSQDCLVQRLLVFVKALLSLEEVLKGRKASGGEAKAGFELWICFAPAGCQCHNIHQIPLLFA